MPPTLTANEGRVAPEPLRWTTMSAESVQPVTTSMMDSTSSQGALDATYQPPKVVVVEVAQSKLARTLGPVVIASAVMAPLLLLPYWATRAKLRQTMAKLARLESVPSTLTRLETQLIPGLRELRTTSADTSSALAETVRKLESENAALRKDLLALARELDKISVRVDTESELSKIRAAQPPQREVKLVSVQEDPRVPSQLLSEVGSSLGTIASFIEEVDIRNGQPRRVDSRGIQRMRAVALKLEQLNALPTSPTPPRIPLSI
ncbi:hypothetical protein CALVIDRAFT_595545 [Calocera viscosa TUFC12733]|uniref:Uncharacterized protein n=1 Tax=Calocera viscosa (strain TUFC12733) TaxID=1330018 RepID=A0A167QQ55_CALVF|nr:hypothetical protein CALVIDRAFT_595545 [Calocera viscosa TUFC12733]